MNRVSAAFTCCGRGRWRRWFFHFFWKRKERQRRIFLSIKLFCITRKCDGQPYKGSSANSLSLNPSAVVDELRLAVVNKNPNILSSVDASQLKIYKNKTAFDGKEETLEDDCLIYGLGLSDKEALVVLVPTPTVSNCTTKQPQSKRKWGFWGLAFLMSHELDAVNCQEWRMLPLLNFLGDNVGYQVFTILHVPIFAAILLGIHSNKNWNRILFQLSVFSFVLPGCIGSRIRAVDSLSEVTCWFFFFEKKNEGIHQIADRISGIRRVGSPV